MHILIVYEESIIYINDSFYFEDKKLMWAYIFLSHDKDKYFRNEEIDNIFSEYKEDIKNIKNYKIKIDNCGNVDFDVDKVVASYLEDYLR